MKKQIILFSILGMLAPTLGCSGGDGGGFEIPSLNPPVTTTPETTDPFANVPLYLDLQLRWETGGEDDKYESFDSNVLIPPLTAQGTTLNYTISIPEARLFYSNVKFKIGSGVPATCPIIKFYPYYYRASLSQTYTPLAEGGVETDCRRHDGTDPIEDSAACYEGAAKYLLKSDGETPAYEFPKHRGIRFFTAISPSNENILLSSGFLMPYGYNYVNFMVTNDLDPADKLLDESTPGNEARFRAGPEVGPPAYANWYDYSIVCENIFGDMVYTLNFTIEDVNDVSGPSSPVDHYPDWSP